MLLPEKRLQIKGIDVADNATIRDESATKEDYFGRSAARLRGR